MVRGRGSLVWLAAVVGAAGCALITGVGDLDPSLPDGDGADSSTSSSGSSSGSSGTPSEGGSQDGSIDTGIDVYTLISDITFENGQIIHPQTGVDRMLYDAGLSLLTKDANVDESGDATAFTAMGGEYSLHVNAGGQVEETFGSRDEIFITARVRIDAPISTTTPLVRIMPESGATPIEIRLSDTRQLTAFLGAQIPGVSTALEIAKVYRIGIYVKKGKNSNGTLEVRVAADKAAFGSPFVQSLKIDFERPQRLQLGLAAPLSEVTFDDVKIDPFALPSP